MPAVNAVAVPPPIGIVYRSPRRSKTIVRPSGDTSREIQVPSSVSRLIDRAATSSRSGFLGAGRRAVSCWAWSGRAAAKQSANTIGRGMRAPEIRCWLGGDTGGGLSPARSYSWSAIRKATPNEPYSALTRSSRRSRRRPIFPPPPFHLGSDPISNIRNRVRPQFGRQFGRRLNPVAAHRGFAMRHARFFLGAAALCSASVVRAQGPATVTITRLQCGTNTAPTDVGQRFSDTYAFTGFKVQLTASCYLVRHNDDYLIWDTGYPTGSAPTAPKQSLVDLLGQLKVTPAQVKYVRSEEHTSEL